MTEIARRTFLRLAALAAGVLAVRPALDAVRPAEPLPLQPGQMIVRRSIDDVELRIMTPADPEQLEAFAAGGDLFIVAVRPHDLRVGGHSYGGEYTLVNTIAAQQPRYR